MSATSAPELFYVPYEIPGNPLSGDDLSAKVGIQSEYNGSNGGGQAWFTASDTLDFDHNESQLPEGHVVSGIVDGNPNELLMSFEDEEASVTDADYNDATFVVSVGPENVSIPTGASITETIATSPETYLESAILTLSSGFPGDSLALSSAAMNELTANHITEGGSGTNELTLTGNALASVYQDILQDVQLTFATDSPNSNDIDTVVPIGGDRGLTIEVTGVNGGTYESAQTIPVGPIAYNEELNSDANQITPGGTLDMGNIITGNNDNGTLYSDSDFLAAQTKTVQINTVSTLGTVDIAGNSYLLSPVTPTSSNIAGLFSFNYQNETSQLEVDKNGEVFLNNVNIQTFDSLLQGQTAQFYLTYTNIFGTEISNSAHLMIDVHG